MTTEQDHRVTRAAQLRADDDVMRQAAEILAQARLFGAGSCAYGADNIEAQAAALEAEVKAEIDAKAAEPVDEWAHAKSLVDAWEDPEVYPISINVVRYVRHLQSRVTELENDECERINDAIDARDTEIAELRAENERLKNDIEVIRETSDGHSGNITRMDICLDEYDECKRHYPLMTLDYFQIAVHYRRKYREAEAKLARFPDLWMAVNKNTGNTYPCAGGNPLLFLSKQDAENWSDSIFIEAVPYDGRKTVAP